MQREGQLTNEAERKLTQELAQNIGKALEDISRATGSVAHLYKTLDMGSTGAGAKVQAKEWEPSFSKMIEECGSVQITSGSGPVAADAPMSQSDEEPIDQLLGIM
jgi:hypothetical protein